MKEIKFEAVLRNVPVFQLVPIDAPPRCRCLSGTIAHELRVFCHEDTLHQSNGEFCFHCALKDHNLEMLWVINNSLSCMLNETCILLTSESTKINSVWREKKKTQGLIQHPKDTHTKNAIVLPRVCSIWALSKKDKMKVTYVVDVSVTSHGFFMRWNSSIRSTVSQGVLSFMRQFSSKISQRNLLEATLHFIHLIIIIIILQTSSEGIICGNIQQICVCDRLRLPAR